MERQRRSTDYVELDGKKAIIEFKKNKDNKGWSDEKIAATFGIRTDKVKEIWQMRRKVEKDLAARRKRKAEQEKRRADIEKKLLKWHKKNKKNLKISGQLLIDTATKYAQKENLDIRFNYVWLNNFKKTHNITIGKSRGSPCSSDSRGVAHENNSDKENRPSTQGSSQSSQTNPGNGSNDDSLPNNHVSDDGEDGASQMNSEGNVEDDSSQNYYDKKADYARVRKGLKKVPVPTKEAASKAVVTLCRYAEKICEKKDYDDYLDAIVKLERIVRKTI